MEYLYPLQFFKQIIYIRDRICIFISTKKDDNLRTNGRENPFPMQKSWHKKAFPFLIIEAKAHQKSLWLELHQRIQVWCTVDKRIFKLLQSSKILRFWSFQVYHRMALMAQLHRTFAFSQNESPPRPQAANHQPIRGGKWRAQTLLK